MKRYAFYKTGEGRKIVLIVKSYPRYPRRMLKNAGMKSGIAGGNIDTYVSV
jgi:hypothetical protein